jgi:CubicO group peptidase (beta-lactamase class C family)
MTESWLGLPATEIDELLPSTLPCQLPVWQTTDAIHWNWNSAYWRTLGAPWGGMISTVHDLGALATNMLQTMADPKATSEFSPAVVRECMANQTQHFAELCECDRLIRPWSYGWRFNWKDHPASFGDFVSSSAIGHWGATGTLMWIDPASQRWLVVLTTQPWEQSKSTIQRISNLVVSTSV